MSREKDKAIIRGLCAQKIKLLDKIDDLRGDICEMKIRIAALKEEIKESEPFARRNMTIPKKAEEYIKTAKRDCQLKENALLQYKNKNNNEWTDLNLRFLKEPYGNPASVIVKTPITKELADILIKAYKAIWPKHQFRIVEYVFREWE